MADWRVLVRERLAPLRLSTAAEASLVEEVAQHLEDRFAELRSAGAEESEAFRQTLAELENVYRLREGHARMPERDAVRMGEWPRGHLLEDLRNDIRYALRTMARSPVFVLFVVATLGLGIGANTTVFTLINSLILNPLPVEKPDGLAAVTGAEAHEIAKIGNVFPHLVPGPGPKLYELGRAGAGVCVCAAGAALLRFHGLVRTHQG